MVISGRSGRALIELSMACESAASWKFPSAGLTNNGSEGLR